MSVLRVHCVSERIQWILTAARSEGSTHQRQRPARAAATQRRPAPRARPPSPQQTTALKHASPAPTPPHPTDRQLLTSVQTHRRHHSGRRAPMFIVKSTFFNGKNHHFSIQNQHSSIENHRRDPLEQRRGALNPLLAADHRRHRSAPLPRQRQRPLQRQPQPPHAPGTAPTTRWRHAAHPELEVLQQRRPAKSINLNTKSLVFITQFLVLNTEFIVFNTEHISSTHHPG